VDHTGKNPTNGPRGTSAKETVLDLSVALVSPEDYDPEDGCRFEVQVKKGRDLCGDAAASFEARLITGTDERATWQTRDIKADLTERIVEMRGRGMTFEKIADELGKPQTTVYRLFKKHEEKGK
jgi:hypothetical protein